jgi:TonB family protein
MIQSKKRNSSKVNLTFSLIFHTSLIVAVIFFAAREGMLGNKLKQITVTMVPKDKKPEPPKEKDQPKAEPPKLAETPKPAAVELPRTVALAPPPSDEQAPIAPAAISLPAFDFSDGAHAVQSVSDPSAIYKGLVEHALRSRWNRPENSNDENYQVEVELSVNPEGKVEGYRWLRGSGDRRWDDSVRAALAQATTIGGRPPKGFPSVFTVRFDVDAPETAASIQLSSR